MTEEAEDKPDRLTWDEDLWAPDEAGWDAERQDPPPSPARAIEETRKARIRSLTYRRSELDAIPPPRYLIDGILNDNALGLLAGKFGTYKSFVSVSLACSIATGVPWLGREVLSAGPVIYVAAEGAAGLKGRIEAWESVYNRGARVPDDRLIVVGGAVNLTSGGDVDAIDELCTEAKPRLLIWDTMHRCAPGVEENSNTEMGTVIHTLDRLRERHLCTQLVNHHTGHSGSRSRGASAIEDDFDNSWVIKLGGDNEDRSAKNIRTMEHRKVKDGELSDPIPIRLAICDVSATIELAEKADSSGWLIEDKVKAKAAECDSAGIPVAFGRDRLKAAAKDAGIASVADEVWSRVAKLRKAA